MTTKLQINQSIKVVHDALTTHLDSFKQDNSFKPDNPRAFDYELRKDGFGIYNFRLKFSEFWDGWHPNEPNLGFIRVRSLNSKLTEMVIEDSVWLERGPDTMIYAWDFDDEIPVEERKKEASAVFDRLRSIHDEVRQYIVERLQEDRLLLEGKKTSSELSYKHTLEPNTHTRVFISYAHEDIESARKMYEQLNEIEGVIPWFDKESLLPGMTWRPAIKKAIRESDSSSLLLNYSQLTPHDDNLM